MKSKKFSKDPKIQLVSIEEFCEISDNLFDCEFSPWKNKKPEGKIYYKFTPRFLILLVYKSILTNFGTSITSIMETAVVAYRDGKTEYDILNQKIAELYKKLEKEKNSPEIGLKIYQFTKAKASLPLFKEPFKAQSQPFENYIVNTNYKTFIDKFKEKYVVFDVETNGVRRSNDDLLSISIYDPTSGKCYNRFLPLDLQPMVLTSWIHGITDKKLEKATHITQQEFDHLIEYFHLKDRILLSYSGGRGTFDSDFVINYCKRHGLSGFEDLKFENIKALIPTGEYGLEGQLTKDNLCKLFGIDGINNVHSGMNDCILEWKLFEKIKDEPLFFKNECLFKYHKGYIVPVTYLNRYPQLINYANINVPYIVGTADCIFNYTLPQEIATKIKKFPTNISGIALEHGINSELEVKKQNNTEFLNENHNHLEYIGKLDSVIEKIPVILEENGTIQTTDKQYEKAVTEINEVTMLLRKNIQPVIDFIKNNVFGCKEIMSQELVISADQKVLALCDLSSEDEILEIKTYNFLREDNTIDKDLARQLYYQSRGRKTYALSIDIIRSMQIADCETMSVNIQIYRIQLTESAPPTMTIRKLDDTEVSILQMIQENPRITNIALATALKKRPDYIGRRVKWLTMLGYIKKEIKDKRSSPWVILRNPDDRITKVKLLFSY